MADPEIKSGKTGKRRLWPRLLLFVSLALNLLVIGIVAGSLALGPDRDRRAPSRDMVAPYTRALSDADRRQIGKRLRESLVSREDERGLLMADYGTVLDILRTEPLDIGALNDVLIRQSERAEQRKLAGQKIFAEWLADMSPQELSAYADRLEAELDRLATGGDRRWRRKPPRD